MAGGRQQAVHTGEQPVGPCEQPGTGVGVDVLVGEVDERLDVRYQRKQPFAQSLNPLPEPAFELLPGGTDREVGLRADEVHDGLRLGEVHPAVKKSALGKFARFRPARPGGEQGFEHPSGDEPSAVAGKFHHVLAPCSWPGRGAH